MFPDSIKLRFITPEHFLTFLVPVNATLPLTISNTAASSLHPQSPQNSFP